MKTAAFLALCGLALAAHSLEISAGHPFPLYDEIAYVDAAREFGELGVLGTVGCYASGTCREDNRHPLYMQLLAPFTDGGPEDFARGKLLSLAVSLVFLLAVFFLTRAAFGETAGCLAAAAVALSPSAAAVAQNVSADGLFALFFAGAIWGLVLTREKPWAWPVFGLLAGMAWLAKGNGHFLLLAGCAAAFKSRGKISLMMAGFTAGGGYLLLRNVRVFGRPFYNINNGQFWLDSVRDYYIMAPFPEWNEVGIRWYFAHHSVLDAFRRFLAGVPGCAVKLAKALAVGPPAGWQVTGSLIALLVALGMVRCWFSGKKTEVLAVGVPCAVLFAAFAWGAPVFGANLRYFVPLAAALLPFAAHEAAVRLKGRERRALLAAAAACAALLVTHRGGLAADPRGLWWRPEPWRETSQWIKQHVDENGYLADPGITYSEWDSGRVKRTLYPYDAPPEKIEALLEQKAIRHVLVDAAAMTPPPDFLGRRRAFASSDGRYIFYTADN